MSTRLFLLGAVSASSLLGTTASAQFDDLVAEKDYQECLAEAMQHSEPAVCGVPFILNTIEVLGDRDFNSPGSSSIVTADVVADVSADHPAEILNTLPGVNIHTNSGQEHLIAIRSPVLTGGAGQGSFLVLENGVPTRSPAFGNVNMLMDVHHETAEAIEVVRGPASAKYGSNAVHGLINFILPGAGRTEDGLDVRLTGSTLSRYKADGVFASDVVGEGSVLSVSLQHDAGWRDDTGLDQQKVSASQGFTLGTWDGEAWFSFVNLNQETGGFVQGPDAYEDEDLSEANANPEAFRDAKYAIAAVRLGTEFGDNTLSVTPYARWQEMEFRQHFLPYKGFEENSHSAWGVQARLDGVVGDLQWRIGSMVDIASGDLSETQPAPFGFFPGDSRFPVGVHYD